MKNVDKILTENKSKPNRRNRQRYNEMVVVNSEIIYKMGFEFEHEKWFSN